MRTTLIVLSAAVLILSTKAVAAADVVDLLPNLLGRLTAPLGPPGATPPGLRAVDRATRAPLARGPESPSVSAGFRYDPALGAFVPAADEFGSIFAQIPDTLAARSFVFALNYVHAETERLDGVPIDDFRIHVGGGLIAEISAEVSTNEFTLIAAYGLLDDLTLDVAVPILRHDARLKGALDTPLGRQTARVSRDVTGVGDIRFGAKYRVYNQDPLAVATRFEVSAPTGNEDDFLGSGAWQLSPSIIGAVRLPFRIRPHLNLAFRYSSDTDDLDHQLFAAAGVDWTPVPWLTLAADLLFTHLLDNDRPEARKTMGVGIPLETSKSEILDVVLGFKVNVWRNVLLGGGVIIPLNDTGYRDDVVPVIAAEIAF